LLGVAARALGLGGAPVAAGAKVDLRAGLDGLRVVGHGPFPYQVDGDYLGEATELTFAHHRDALRLLVP
jgi:diacylglycerol kinase family enzyme